MKKISIVIPVYREEKNIPVLYRRLEAVTQPMVGYSWEYIFVNDGSPDQSIEKLKQLANQDSRVKIIDFSRNFGKEVALTAGVHEAKADAAICMDADCQHPPELIPQLVDEWEKGAEVVATIRTSIERQPLMRRLGSHVYYWLMNKISGIDMVSQTTDYRLYDKKVLEVFKRITERERMFRGIMDWMGFNKVYVEFRAAAREQGEPGYSYLKLWHLAVNSITAFSLWPLRLTGYFGVAITVFSSLLLVWMLCARFFWNPELFSSLAFVVVANTLLIGIVLMSIGLVALYIGAIHTEVVNRPLYIVRDYINFDENEECRNG